MARDEITSNHQLKSKGYTIIELLFAVANFAFIIMIAISAFVAVMKVYNKSNTARHTQQVARSITEQIQRDLKYGSLAMSVNAPWSAYNDLCIRASGSMVHYRVTSKLAPGANGHRYMERAELPNPSDTVTCPLDDDGATYVKLNPPSIQIRGHSYIVSMNGVDPDEDFENNAGPLVITPKAEAPGNDASTFVGQGTVVWLMFSVTSFNPSITPDDPFFDMINVFTAINVRKGGYL